MYFRFLRSRAEQYGDEEVITALEELRSATTAVASQDAEAS